MTKTSYVLEGIQGAPVLVAANSVAADYTMWDLQIAEWRKHFQVLRYSYRGHGATPANGNKATSKDLADDIISLVDQLGIKEFHWAGLSLGGMLGLYMAAHYPSRVKSLVAACFRPYQTEETAGQWAQRIVMVEDKGMEPLVSPTAERWLTEAFRKARPDQDQAIRHMIATTSVPGYQAVGHVVKDYDARPYMDKVVCPVQLIAGLQDGGAPFAEVESLTKILKNAQYVALPAAHIANIECAPEFTKIVVDFIHKQA